MHKFQLKPLMALFCLVVTSNFARATDLPVSTASPIPSSSPSNDLCKAIGLVAKTSTPVDLYRSLGECIKQGKYDLAVDNFALAGVFGRFDTLRVTDVSAHQSVGFLKNVTLDATTPSNRAEFQKYAGAVYDNKEQHTELCKRISQAGPPSYYPAYMLNHGIGAMLNEKQAVGGIVSSFNAGTAWQSALSTYLGCQ